LTPDCAGRADRVAGPRRAPAQAFRMSPNLLTTVWCQPEAS
jgi:hypothetical protein